MNGLTITRLTITTTRSGLRVRAMVEADNGDTYERLAASRDELAEDLRAEFGIHPSDFCPVCGHPVDNHDRRAEDGECFDCPREGRLSCFDRMVCESCGYVESASGSAMSDNAHDSLCCGRAGDVCNWALLEGQACVTHEDRAMLALADLIGRNRESLPPALVIVRLPFPMSSI